MLKHNGFTLIEVLVGISILFVVIKVFVPMSILLYKERTLMNEKRAFSSLLHDELQHVIWDETIQIPKIYTKNVNDKILTFEFMKRNNELMIGCVTWINVRNKEEDVCFYAYKK